ncbi:nitrous oxide reductase accessory protein NosL [Solitalea lacus]|uniref:nitrous oxide reductase accessory protein NosL n=1 Tax=Solitalea lacus TaxID=2911172 RepID=UPI001EDC8B40|nr:nitrous oxide reductase accessory protein NosL [Solitalea lacus]UKJ07969.1 nitrous oxide reductase accessory protein NosL [Solitalea lacus]
MTNKISIVSKLLLIISAVLLAISIFVPIWQIDLQAPQYPEGLSLEIWANKIAGDVNIINGLNHYIGMKTLHTEDFIEFTVLPYIIGTYVLLFLFAALNGTKKCLYISFGAFLLFGILAMIDFWKWEYNYGHNLDPNAAIIVPGMAYQPPLIGYKQLLNFAAYSMPDIGGWSLAAAGLLVLIAVLLEKKLFKSDKNSSASFAFISGIIILSSCEADGPQAINLNKDACDFCRMTISDGRFGSEMITRKGRAYKFDDIDCMLKYSNEHKEGKVKSYYVMDYSKNNVLIDASKAWFVHHADAKSPMGGNTVAFSAKNEAEAYANKLGVHVESWQKFNKKQ